VPPSASSRYERHTLLRGYTFTALQSNNRTNVALSRAKEAMYIFGDAPLLASHSQMWRSVIDELDSIGCIGPGIPISCQRHPEEMTLAGMPGEIRQYAPDGRFNR
jgi:hypothetical protein